ncbi:hypothetical protein RM780_27105 [Streptomyces sp. DSM 44917]|uniref:Uncharacterized protein n=1 Tax=Streptomyces boetiae TaxID=3075541 RepID=A0ABU2LG76_9ACTN|nr:hypothetical protein [Streptomyces sp. DSM 44917]MDT0310589.1 hypothetical protein [Streptomyces sp. DSM 44917]
MEFTLATSAVGAGDEAELRSLHRWLTEDPYVRRNARADLAGAVPAEGEMSGGALEYVRLVLDSGFQLANLALAWYAWRGTRPRPPEITVEHGGKKVTLSGQDPDTAARLLAALTREEP